MVRWSGNQEVRWSGGQEVRRSGGQLVSWSGGHVCTVLLVQVMNAACTARPAVIVVPNTSEDVAAVVRAASSSGLELSVRSGGHSYTCTNLKEGGVHVDMRSAQQLVVIREFINSSVNTVMSTEPSPKGPKGTLVFTL